VSPFNRQALAIVTIEASHPRPFDPSPARRQTCAKTLNSAAVNPASSIAAEINAGDSYGFFIGS
jgi:hypothetical protein